MKPSIHRHIIAENVPMVEYRIAGREGAVIPGPGKASGEKERMFEGERTSTDTVGGYRLYFSSARHVGSTDYIRALSAKNIRIEAGKQDLCTWKRMLLGRLN